MANARLIGLKKEQEKNKQLYDELFVSDSNFRLVSSSPKVFSAIHKDDFGENFYISEEELNYYVDGFIQAITDNIEIVKQSIITEEANNNPNGDSGLDDNDIKLSLYRSFKSLNDKWIISSNYGGVNKNRFFYENDKFNTGETKSLFEYFSFINRCGSDIGKKAVIDFSYLSNLTNTQNGEGPTKTLYESLTGVLSKNNFDFFPLPSFVTYSEENLSPLTDMFKAMDGPLNNLSAEPNFVCMFIGGNSRKLDIPMSYCGLNRTEFQHKNDSFDINDPTTYPEDFINNGGITAFKVRYGQEAQNHFSRIELDQAEFKETQDSLMVIDALTNPSSGSDPTQIGKGNNIYDMYLTRSYTCTVESLGNMQIQPMMFFKLENVPMFRGTYLITDVSHSIKPHNVITTFKGVRQPITTVPIVTEALSLLDLSLVEIVQPSPSVQTVTTQTQNEAGILGPGGGAGLEPIIALTTKGESAGGDYNIYNFGKSGGKGIKSSTPTSPYYDPNAYKLTQLTVTEILDLQSSYKMFAVGKYQTIPVTLKSSAEKLGLLNAVFNQETQDKIGLRLLIGDKRPSLSSYLKGTNEGNIEHLENAVQDLGLEFASKPIITKKGVKWGDVETGKGNKGYYGGSGPNPDTVKISVGTVVNALIKSRIQYSGKNPDYIPSYYTS